MYSNLSEIPTSVLIKELQKRKFSSQKAPTNAWRITTEGDVEGKSVKEIGTYIGHPVQILAYFHQFRVHPMYGFSFTPTEELLNTVNLSSFKSTANFEYEVLFPRIPSLSASVKEEERVINAAHFFNENLPRGYSIETKPANSFSGFNVSVTCS